MGGLARAGFGLGWDGFWVWARHDPKARPQDTTEQTKTNKTNKNANNHTKDHKMNKYSKRKITTIINKKGNTKKTEIKEADDRQACTQINACNATMNK